MAFASEAFSPTGLPRFQVPAFPAVSAGIYGWPADDAARIALTTVATTKTDVELARFVLFSDEMLGRFVAAAEAAGIDYETQSTSGER